MASVASLRALKAMPGPGPLFMFTAGKRIAEMLIDEGTRHSRLFRLDMGPQKCVVVTHPTLAREVITRPSDFPKLTPPPTIAGVLDKDHKGENQNIVLANGAKWQRLQKPVAPAFEGKTVQQLVPIFNTVSEALVQKWAAQQSGIVDVKTDMSAFALDVLGAAVLGKDFGALTGEFQDTYDHYKYVMQEQSNPLFLAFPFLERVSFLPRNKKLTASVRHMREVLQSAVDARLSERANAAQQGRAEQPPRDMLDLVLGPGDGSNEAVDLNTVAPLLWVFFIAGHDTTAIALTWMVHHLAANPDMQEKARAEVLEVLKGSDNPTAAQLEKASLPYISALVKENLRLRPPVYNLMTRAAKEDTHLDGYLIPKGTMISIHIGAVNRHPDVYDDPDLFDPERFLNGNRMRVFENMPFSAGPRRCLGDQFSLLEQRSLLVKLLSKVELLPAKNANDDGGEVSLAGDSIPMVLGQPDSMHVRVRAL